MTSIVDPSNKVLQGIPGNLVVRIQVETEQILTHLEEGVGGHQDVVSALTVRYRPRNKGSSCFNAEAMPY